MMTKKKDEAPETPRQSEEARNAVIARSAAGRQTAIGQARADFIAENSDDEKPEIPGGYTEPIAGGDPTPDNDGPTEPQGAQADPAILTTNGTIPVNMLPSPGGLVPVSAVVADPHQGAKLVQENYDATEKQLLRSGTERLSRAKIESMNAGDLRSVASDRGYDIGDRAGSRMTRERFIAAQNKDTVASGGEPEETTALDANIAP